MSRPALFVGDSDDDDSPIGIAPTVAGAGAGASTASSASMFTITKKSAGEKEPVSFYLERDPSDTLVEISKPDEKTSDIFYYLTNNRPEKIGGSTVGAGAFGRVFLVKVKDKNYIIKYIPLRNLQNVDAAFKEIEMLQLVDGSPYVLRLEAAIILPDRAYLVSPYIPGKTLKDWLRVNKEKADRIRVYNQLLDGIEYIHSKGVIHRDIKPENIWIPDDISLPAFYLDFGISVVKGTRTVYQGTAHYKPASLFGIGPQTEHLNYYSLGVLFDEHPIPDSALSIDLKSPELTPDHVKGARFSRRRRGGRRTRRQSKLKRRK
jgi:hypothetical protein